MRCPTLAELPPPPEGKTGWPWTEETSQLPDLMPDGKSWPKISIVTPSFNQGVFIEETIRSILLQGYPDLEYCIMDGGSTDDTISIIKKYEQFLSWVSQEDEGQTDAIAKGFDQSSGTILAWINSDDRYLPDTFRKIAEAFNNHNTNLVFVHGDVRVINEHNEYLYTIVAARPNRFLTVNTALGKWPQPGSFWRRDAYNKAGGVDKSFRFCMDLDLFIRLVNYGDTQCLQSGPLADFRLHQDSKTSTLSDIENQEKQIIIQKYGSPFFSKLYPLLLLGWIVWMGRRIFDVMEQKKAEYRLNRFKKDY